MRITRKTSLWVAAVAVLTSLPAFAGEGDAAGVVRISDSGQRQTIRGQSPAKQATSTIKRASYQGCTDGGCSTAPVGAPGFGSSSRGGVFGSNGGRGSSSSWGSSSNRGSSMSRFGSSSFGSSGRGGVFGGSNALTNGSSNISGSASRWWQGQLAMRRARTTRNNEALKNLFCPTGNCGVGAPPIGHYNMVYSADPNYFDQRDGSLYSAQGYGTPVTVPLAPNVHHQFNYGWGMPSSRITQISTPAGYSVQRPIHW